MRNNHLTGRTVRAILLSQIMIAATASRAQFTVQIGDQLTWNDSITYPAPYGNQAFGARHQWLYLASELTAAGLVPNCSITGLALGVHDTGAVDLTGLTINMKNTVTTEFATAAFETSGLVQVWGPYDVDDQLGWNQHDLDVPFQWDGVSNLLVQTCYGNGSGSYNAEMYHTATSFNSVVYRATANANVCTSALGLINISPLRPSVQITWSPPMIPPVAAFTSGSPMSCSATVAFTDLSDYVPTGWAWDFGDGSAIDNAQNPVHTFPGDGSYVVTLIDTNAYGADTAVATITINGAGLLPVLACVPYASDSLAGNGLANVSYLGVSYSSGDAEEGYQDRTCVNDTTQLGDSFTLSAEASGPAPQRMAAWIDWNNDAAFDPSEQVLDAVGTTVSATVNVPVTAVVNTPLRVRVMADDTAAAALDPCTGPLFGQAEDYALVVLPIVDPPVAAFAADPVLSCDGIVGFTDLSSNIPTGWSWDFGDGTAADTTQNPVHIYAGAGVYTVSLIASNAYGNDTLTQVDLITVLAAGACDTIQVPDGAGGSDLTVTDCSGILVDDGGPSANYTPGTSAAVTIAPIGAATVTLTFSLFEFNTGGAGDFLAVYDGPDVLSPLIGSWTGSGVGVLPGGGVITSTGPSITIQQQCTPGTGVDQGFLLNWQCTPDTVPPVAAFTPSTTFSCDGTISFTDESSGDPTAWSWDFGDGSPLDNTQDPTHTYLSDGSFTVTLTATNAYGSGSTSTVVSVNTGGALPPPACIPTATGAVAGIGIGQVSYGAIVNNSADAFTEGYLDLTCMNDTFLVCTPMTLSVQATASGFQHNIAAWVDWDNNGLFGSGEQILGASNTTSASVTMQIPASAALGTPLRLRVMADLNVSPPLAACNNPLYGQAEDYSVIVMANPNPPAAAFSLVPTPTCDGTVQFTDESLNCPTGWEWDFGDASPVDNTQDPLHTYTASGTYDVTLIATNAIGSDTLVMVGAVTVDLAGQLLPASCTPQTVGYLANYGLLNFTFAGINSSSPDGIEGYQDRSCGNTATVQEGTVYQLDAILGGDAQPDMFVWIDFDDNGAFAAGELIFSSAGTHTPSAAVTIPLGSVYNTPVRLRVSTDVAGNITTGCTQPQYGQTEDFACIVLQNTDPPVAAFSASPISSCDGVVDFTDLSTNLPTGWTWDFGDGSPTDNTQNPTHTYTTIGTYTVSLTATNTFGSDTDVQVDLITVVDPAFCDTVLVPNGPGGPGGGADTTVADCFGVVTDDGGPINNYTPGYSSALTIAPPGAQWVTLTFSQFEFDAGVGGGGTGGTPDSLWIFDGPDIFSPAIGWWTGYGVGVLPNSGVITSSGGSITLQQRCTGGGMSVDLGFIANWNCSMTAIEEVADTELRVWPQPSTGEVNIGLSRGAVAGERIVVNDPLGRIVMVEEMTPGTRTVRLDLSPFGAGCYSLSLQGEAGRWTRGIILN